MIGGNMQDFIKQQADWLSTWQEKQKTLTNQFSELSKDWSKNIAGAQKKQPDVFEGWFKSQGNLSDQFSDFSKRMNEMIQGAMGNKLPPEVMKFMNISFFEQFYKNWLSNIELPGGMKNPLGMGGDWSQATNFLNSFVQKENPFFSSFSNNKINDQMSWLFGLLQGAMGKEENAFSNVINGFQDMLGKLFDSTTAQGSEKIATTFEAWAKEMEKHLIAPKVGINRELTHDVSQALVLTQDYVRQYVKMTQLVEGASRKAGIRFQTKMGELALQKKPVNKFADVCALWSVENETVFLDLLGSDEFVKIQGDFSAADNRLKIQWNKLAEKALKATPIALKRDLDLAIAEIHQLKRDLKTMQRESKAKDKEMQVIRDFIAKAESEAKKVTAAKAVEVEAAKQVKAVEVEVAKPVKTETTAVKTASKTTAKSKAKNV
jgi:hypothetical protein